MKRAIAGGLLMFVALGLQMAMVVRAIEPDALLSLSGYVGLFVGMGLVLVGVLRRPR